MAEIAYYIYSNDEATIIDPLRETEPYIKMAEADDAKIKYLLLTLQSEVMSETLAPAGILNSLTMRPKANSFFL